MKKFLLDSILFFYLFHVFAIVFFLYTFKDSGVNIELSHIRYSPYFWVFSAPAAILFSAFRNKTTVNKVYLTVGGFFWTLFLAFLPLLVIGIPMIIFQILSSPGRPR